MRRARRREEVARLEAELASARPFLGLAREIRDEVARVAADEHGQGESLVELMERMPRQERLRVARAVFDALPPGRQWEIIERVYDDEEIRAALADQRAARLDEARRQATRASVARTARADGRLDTTAIPPHETVTLGLFREADVRTAMRQGHRSTSCARRLVLASVDERGGFQVVEDVYNPAGGYFVTAEYDEHTWRTADRLAPHALVRVGSIVADAAGRRFEPVLRLGGRVDLETEGRPAEGRLHLGYAMLGEVDVFAGPEWPSGTVPHSSGSPVE